MSANEHIEELLSGFLDGELTAEELREFELALSTDASLKSKLEQLRQLGNDLRSIPKRKLGVDFTASVVAAALAAREASIEQPVQIASTLPSKEGQANSWKLLGIVVALAATLLMAIFVFNGSKTGTIPSGDVIADNQPTDVRPSEITSVPPSEIASDTRSDVSIDPDSKDESGSYVRNDPNMRKRVGSQNSVAMLTIMQIELSEKAWKEDEVSKILKEAGIAWTNPVKMSDEILGVLNETRSVNQGPKVGDEQVSLVMVMAKGRTLDRALKRILDEVDAFPHVMMDIAFDIPGKELCQKLVDAQGTVANGQQAIATPIVPGAVSKNDADDGALEKASHFTSAPLPAEKYFAASSRQTGQSENAVLANEEDADSHVLLVIRKPATK